MVLTLATNIIISFFVGLIPVLIWLWLFEHEDKNPEPLRLTVLAFVGGMTAVIIALILEILSKLDFKSFFMGGDIAWMPITPGLIIVWAIIEEGSKFLITYWAVLRSKENDEPIDSIMYMITAALGFAALENALYFFGSFHNDLVAEAFASSAIRIFGATLLHVVTSGVIGAALAFSFYLSTETRQLYLGVGLILSIALHSLFNLTILFGNGSTAIFAFFGVWTFCIFLLIIFQKVKHITSKQP